MKKIPMAFGHPNQSPQSGCGRARKIKEWSLHPPGLRRRSRKQKSVSEFGILSCHASYGLPQSRSMKLQKILLPLLALPLSLLCANEKAGPNVILIISDDQGFTDYGFMGSKVVRTPHLDKLASQSLVYTRGYVMPVCSPSLACLLTGKLPHEHGITGNDLLDRDAMTARKSVFVESYTHDIADLANPSKSLVTQVVIDGWSKLLLPGTTVPDKSFADAPKEIELFHLKADPMEKSDVASKHPEAIERLRQLLRNSWSRP